MSSYKLSAVFLEDIGPPPPASGRIAWTGGGGTSDWFLADNWNPVRLPAETDSVEISLTGAVVDLVDPGLILPTTIRHLSHSAGTLRVSGPTNCPNCGNLAVTEGVTSSGPTTLLKLARAVLNIGRGSSFVAIEEEVTAGVAARGAGVLRTAAASGILGVTVQRLNGSFYFSGLDIVLTGQSTLEGGASLGQGSLTISPTAVADLTPGPQPALLGGGLDNRVEIAGTLRVLTGIGQMDFGAVEVVPGGVIEMDVVSVRFTLGLTNRGAIRKLPGGTYDPNYQVFGQTTLAQGSMLEGQFVEFRGNATIGGPVNMAEEIRVAELEGWTALIEDASLLSTPVLRVGVGPTTIQVPQDANSIDILVSQLTTNSTISAIVITGPARLALTELQLRSRALSGGSSGGRISAERIVLDGLAVPRLDNIELEIAGPSASYVNVIVTALNGTRIIQRGRINFTSGGFGRPPLSPPGAFYFEHRGELQAASGQSSIQGCITTTGGTILPANQGATLTLFPLDPVECP